MFQWVSSLIKDSLVYGLGFSVSRFIQLFTLPLIAKALSVAEYGYYSNYLIFYTIAGGALLLGMDNAVARFSADAKTDEESRIVFSNGLMVVVTLSILALGVFFVIPEVIIDLINVPTKFHSAFLFVATAVPFLVLNNFFLSWFKWKRQKWIFLSNVIGSVICLLVPLISSDNLEFDFIFICILFSQAAPALFSFIFTFKLLRLKPSRYLLWSMIKYGLPWMFVFILGLSRSYLDRFFLMHNLSVESYGIYNFSVRISTFISLAISAFDRSFGPLAFSIWKRDFAPVLFARIQSLYILVVALIACFISAASRLLVFLLGGEKFVGAESIVPLLLFSSIPLSLINFSNLGIVYAKKATMNLSTLIIGFLTVLLLNVILVPPFLQYGSASASILGHLAIVTAGYYISYKYYRIPFYFLKDFVLFSALFALATLLVEIEINSSIIVDAAVKVSIVLAVGFSCVFVVFGEEARKVQAHLRNVME